LKFFGTRIWVKKAARKMLMKLNTEVCMEIESRPKMEMIL